MPISSKVLKNKDLTIFTATGELTLEVQMDALKPFYEGEPTRNVLWDMRGITGIRISSDELQLIIKYIKLHTERRPSGKTALVTKSDLDFGLGRMSESYAQQENLPWEIRVFASMSEAKKWLDEDP